MPEAETSEHVGGAMLPIFLSDLQRNNDRDLVEVTLNLDDTSSFVLYSVKPSTKLDAGKEENSPSGLLSSSTYAASGLCRKFPWLRSPERDDHHHFHQNEMTTLSAREEMKSRLQLVRNKSTAQRALGGLRFISKTTRESDTNNDLWEKVETRFNALAKDGLLAREDFGECIGMADSKEFAAGVFDALVRRQRQKISKAELHEFWLQISNESFHARLQIYFDMCVPLSYSISVFHCRLLPQFYLFESMQSVGNNTKALSSSSVK